MSSEIARLKKVANQFRLSLDTRSNAPHMDYFEKERILREFSKGCFRLSTVCFFAAAAALVIRMALELFW